MTIVTENELTDEGAQSVADIIKANTTITELDLSAKLKDSPDARLITYLFCSSYRTTLDQKELRSLQRR